MAKKYFFKFDKSTIDFNKEIFFAEIGAVFGAPSLSFIVSRFSASTNFISSSAVLGGLMGACVFWIIIRIWDKNQKKKYSIKNLANDIAYFTPAAFLLAVLFYYPTLFFFSKHFLVAKHCVLYSVLVSQFFAFVFFLTSMNIYRKILLKFTGKKL